MKDSFIKGIKFIGLGFLEPLIRLINKEDPQKNTKEVLRKIVAPIASIFIFIGLWQLGSKTLYYKEASYKIEAAERNQGPEEAAKLKACMESGDTNCQPNTLPSPSQVYDAYQTLLKDHRQISGR